MDILKLLMCTSFCSRGVWLPQANLINQFCCCCHAQGIQMFLPCVPKAGDSSGAYEAMHAGLQQAINTLNNHWYRSIKPEITNKLNDSLLRQDSAAGLLSVNMDEELATMLEEVRLAGKCLSVSW
jgi:hypothetical protein